jgi:hypothetical protein
MTHIVSFKTFFFAVIVFFSAGLLAQSNEGNIAHIKSKHILTERIPVRVLDRGIMPTEIIQIDTNAKMMGLKTINLNVETQFGIINKLQGEFSYDGFDFNEFAIKRTVALGAKYNYLSIPHISFSASAQLPIHIYDGEIVRDVTFGIPVVFYNNLMAANILGKLFHFTMRGNMHDKMEVEFSFPFWYGIQIYENLWAMITTSFGSIKKEDSAKWAGEVFWKKLPAELSLTYAFNHYVDLSGNFGFKNIIQPEKSDMFFGITLSTRAGRLFG